jgi:hypothetical protein
MDKENIAYICNEVLFNLKEKLDYAICQKMDGTGDHQAEWNKPHLERKI